MFDFVITNHEDKYDHEDEVLALGARVIRAPHFSIRHVPSLASWWHQLLSDHNEWRIVHSHDPLSASISLAEARRLGRATVAHSHFTGPNQGLDGLVRSILRWPVRYVAQTRLACSTPAKNWMFGRRSAAAIVRNGIDLAKFEHRGESRDEARNELGLGDALVVGHIGRFVPVKNHTRVLNMFKQVLRVEPSARLVLVGDGPLRIAIEEEMRLLGIAEQVIPTGTREDVPDLLAAMDVLLFPSHYEGLGIAVIEAQASGLPCVASDAVPREARLTELVRFISLDEPDEVWAKAVIDARLTGERTSRTDELRAAGYDSAQVAQEMQDLYRALAASQAAKSWR